MSGLLQGAHNVGPHSTLGIFYRTGASCTGTPRVRVALTRNHCFSVIACDLGADHRKDFAAGDSDSDIEERSQRLQEESPHPVLSSPRYFGASDLSKTGVAHAPTLIQRILEPADWTVQRIVVCPQAGGSPTHTAISFPLPCNGN